jgi:AcrR family transcriptional regulator
VTGEEASGAKRRRGRPPAQEGKDTRARLLDAARQCFCRKGYASTSMSEIAAEAGVTARAIYHYVDSKSDLFAHTAEAAYSRFLREVLTHVFSGDHPDTRSRLRSYTHVFRVLYQEDPSLVAFMSLAVLETSRHPELVGALPGVFHDDLPNFNEMLVTGAVESGELGPDVAPDGLVAMLDVFGAGLTIVAGKERRGDYLAMLDAIDHLLDGSLFVK